MYDLNYIITCIIDFFLDPLKPHFYYISTGLRGSVLHGDFSLMERKERERKVRKK